MISSNSHYVDANLTLQQDKSEIKKTVPDITYDIMNISNMILSNGLSESICQIIKSSNNRQHLQHPIQDTVSVVTDNTNSIIESSNIDDTQSTSMITYDYYRIIRMIESSDSDIYRKFLMNVPYMKKIRL